MAHHHAFDIRVSDIGASKLRVSPAGVSVVDAPEVIGLEVGRLEIDVPEAGRKGAIARAPLAWELVDGGACMRRLLSAQAVLRRASGWTGEAAYDGLSRPIRRMAAIISRFEQRPRPCGSRR